MKNESASILIVDDELLLARLFSDYLSAEGFTTQIAYDGEEALKVVQNTAFDILLTDFNMPNLNGLELITQLRQYPRLDSMKIVLMTGLTNNKEIPLAIDLSDEYLEKPIELGLLSATLKAIQRD